MMKKEERLAMIRRIGTKINLEKKGKFALAAAFNTRTRKPAELTESKLEKMLASIDDSTNINAWSDSEKFARQEVGDVYEATTKFDNEWD